MDDFEAVTPPTAQVSFRGEVLEVGPLRLEQLSPFITASRSIIGRVVMAAGLLGEGAQMESGAVVLDLLEQDGPAFASALAVVTGRPADWIAKGTVDEVASLVEAVVGLNRDFFARRLPHLVAKVAKPKNPPTTDGLTSSTSSSPADTSAATS